MKPFASVIIPVFNGEKYIVSSLSSVLKQTVEDTEIILVDDASTDLTIDKVKASFSEFIGKKIFILSNEKNRERAESRNRGVEASRSDFVFFLDHDDEWSPNYLESMLSFFIEEKCEMVYSHPRTFIDEKGRTIRISKKIFSEDIGENIFSGLVGYPSSTGFRKKSFPKYKDRYIPREDWEIFINSFFLKRTVRMVDNNLVKIRSHRERTSKNPKFWASTLLIYNDYFSKIPKQYRAFFLFHIGDVCLRFGDLKRGFEFIFRSAKEDPRVLLEKRHILNLFKRSFRFDRYFRLYRKRRSLIPTK